jgi:hypothetical protein
MITDDFESYAIPAGPTGDAGTPWLVGGEVFDPFGGFLFNFFAFPAPHATGAFSNIGTDGTNQFMEIFSNYDPGLNRADGSCDPNDPDFPPNSVNIVNAFFFQGQTIGMADLGNGFTFQFDTRNINADFSSPELISYNAFVRVFTPDFSMLLVDQQIPVGTSAAFATQSIDVLIDPAWDGFVLQYGFISSSTGCVPTAIAVDNVSAISAPIPEPEVSPIPTLGEWGLILMSFLMLTVGLVYIRQTSLIAIKQK